jgi:hypothetical protein
MVQLRIEIGAELTIFWVLRFTTSLSNMLTWWLILILQGHLFYKVSWVTSFVDEKF